MDQPSPAEIARRYHLAESERALNELILLLKHELDYGRTVLEALANSKDAEIRLWVTEAAGKVLGRDAIPILHSLLRDRDTDVRIEALTAIVDLDPDEARRMGKTLRRRARSDDFYEAQAALWALGAIRDVDALDVIGEATSRYDAIARNTAIAVELLLTAPDELCRRIEEHDHELMPWLTKAAELLGTDKARSALERCEAEAPDDECRFWASKTLGRFKGSGS